MQLIQTQRHNIPWRWVFLVGLMGVPYIMMFFIAAGEGALLTLSLRKYVEKPFLINAILSCDIAFNILIGATCLYLSDRVWTRFGRRKPFILVSWISLSVCLALIPLANSALTLIPLIILLFAVMDIGTTADMLVIEIIPPHQRGRYEALKGIYLHILIIVFALTMQGRFFETGEKAGVSFLGQQAIFWIGAFVILIGSLILILFIKENKPEEPARQDAPKEEGNPVFRPIKAVLLERNLWPVYLLAFSLTLVQVNLGPIGVLLITEQWGYTMQDIGVNVTIGCTVNICILPVIGYLADKYNRLVMFSGGVFFYVLVVVMYFIFVQFILPDHRPQIWMMVAFGMCQSICNLFVMTNFNPLCFDYIPRDKIGTAQAGINLVRSITKWIAMIGVGIWVQSYSGMFRPVGETDYFSGYIYVTLMSIIGSAFMLNFILRVRSGKLKPLGREGYEEKDGSIVHISKNDGNEDRK